MYKFKGVKKLSDQFVNEQSGLGLRSENVFFVLSFIKARDFTTCYHLLKSNGGRKRSRLQVGREDKGYVSMYVCVL